MDENKPVRIFFNTNCGMHDECYRLVINNIVVAKFDDKPIFNLSERSLQKIDISEQGWEQYEFDEDEKEIEIKDLPELAQVWIKKAIKDYKNEIRNIDNG